MYDDEIEAQTFGPIDGYRGHVRDLALECGFSLKLQDDGRMDLNEYVYDFAARLRGENFSSGPSNSHWDSQPSLLVPLFRCGRVYLFTDRQMLAEATTALGVEMDDLDGSEGVSQQIEGQEGEYAFILGVFDRKLTTLVHELSHVTFNIMARVGVTVDAQDPNETFCYMLEELLEFFLPFIVGEIL